MKGFSNQQIATILLLVVITSALRKNFAIEAFFDFIFRKAKTQEGFLWRMMVYVAGLSSFLNNTPIVAVMSPYVYNWCKRNHFYPSKMLIPLSFATIMGGMITVLGTSTNMVLNSYIVENNLPPFQFLDFFIPGVLVASAGIVYLYFVGFKLLPKHKNFQENSTAQNLDYFIEVEVGLTSRLIGGTVTEAGLMSIKGAHLIEIHRGGNTISPIKEHELLLPEDVLVFMGKPEVIIELANNKNGLRLPKHKETSEIIEAVIPANSSLNGKNAHQINFPQQYGADIIAIHRNGERLDGKIGDKKLSQGDLLLLSAGSLFEKKTEGKDLYVISKVKEGKVLPNPKKIKIFLLGLLGVVVAVAFGVFPLFAGLLFMIGMFMLLDLFSLKEISKEIDMDLVVLFVCSLTLSSALIKTGAADLIAQKYVGLIYPLGKTGVLCGLFFITVILTSFISNVGTVSVIFPIAYSVSLELGLDGMPFFIAIAFGASADFITPIGYQTNWMVYGPGGYSAKDFFKVGFPLVLLYSFILLAYLILRYRLY